MLSQPPKPVLPLVAVFSRHETALEWAVGRIEQGLGAIGLTSERFDFEQTNYYSQTMGESLWKQFFLLERLADPAMLADWKVMTNRWEQELAATGDFEETRPVNLDPGYVTEAKLVLATTKDRDHRIYLREGIYAEVTLYYNQGQWKSRPWTYPDYELPLCHEFLTQGRQRLREMMRQ